MLARKCHPHSSEQTGVWLHMPQECQKCVHSIWRELYLSGSGGQGIKFKGTVQEAMADLVRALAGKALQG